MMSRALTWPFSHQTVASSVSLLCQPACSRPACYVPALALEPCC